MKFEGRFFSVVACAAALVGLSTSASATIIGTGCVVTGIAGQTVPSSVTAFMSECTGSTVVSGGEYTFSATDTLSLDLGPGSTPDDGVDLISALGGTLTGGLSAASYMPATSGSAGTGGNETVWWLHEENIVPGTYPINLSHDDGVVLLQGAATIINSPGPEDDTMSSAMVTVPAGGTLDLLYVECCGFAAVLQGTMPPEEVVPEPGSFSLVTLGAAGILLGFRRRAHR